MLQILGGVLIGISVSLVLLFHGRITGISGILGSVLNARGQEKSWKIFFMSGLFSGGLLLAAFIPEAFSVTTGVRTVDYVMGGFLVGVGTLLGNGCTSGHGVCGISRFSIRSVMATIVFIAAGAISVAVFRYVRGGL